MELARLVDQNVVMNFLVDINVKRGLFKFASYSCESRLVLNNLHYFQITNFIILFSFRCHGPVPPPNPEFTLKPTKKKLNKHLECAPGSPCPPCKEVIWVPCFGRHIGEERAVCFSFLRFPHHAGNFMFSNLAPFFQMLCHSKRRFSCQNLCGNLLSCGNHYCTKPCHVLKNQTSNLDQYGQGDSNTEKQDQLLLNAVTKQGEPCEDCFLPCQKV